MKKLIHAFLSAGIAGAAIAPSHAQEEPKDGLTVLGVIDWDYLPDYINVGTEYNPEHAGHDVIIFGLHTSDTRRNNTMYEKFPCLALLKDDKGVNYIRNDFSSIARLQLSYDYQDIRHTVTEAEFPALQQSVEPAIERAKELCQPKIS